MICILTAMLLAFSSWSGGVGGLAGGNTGGITNDFRGGKILFQEESRMVSPLDRTLCRKNGEYQAEIKVCGRIMGREGDFCAVWNGRRKIYQPIESEKWDCVKPGTKFCQQWGWVEFYQSPVRELILLDQRGEDTRDRVEVEVPHCNR